ncbi:MAG: hypothetical protein JWN37_718 [Candidatus Nomurabacteria bacterium]|nr:hypothetical protein [Candidatus Nomurabacteria bacterium]
MKILILGPSGSGKTYTSFYLRRKNINAFDADTIPGLAGYFDSKGNEVEFPIGAGKEFLDTHEFLWSREFLKVFLKKNNDVYLFGMAGNAFDMVDLFDKVFFLNAEQEVLAERLRHESRENPMGKTDYQLQNALNWATEIEEEARGLGIKMIDANLPPEEIFKIIST